MPIIERIGDIELEAAALWRDHPPRFKNERKRELVERVMAPTDGTIHVSRWTGSLPEKADPVTEPEVEIAERAFDYPPDAPGMVRWHLNFADAELFGYYAGSLLAQDELQVLEHPILGSVRELLVALGGEPLPRTRDAAGRATPILVRGAPRSLAFDASGGLYGNAFARADPDRIAAATTYLDPPTLSNIVAIEAPPGGHGAYLRATIEDILHTAVVGFAACREASAPSAVTVHTGGWGTGAFGGDKVLMALLQLCAARLAGMDRLVFHTLTSRRPFDTALGMVDELPWGAGVPIGNLVEAVHARGFVWGVSDGN